MPKAEEKRADRRGDILQAAETLFAETGFASVSIRDIAAAADVPIALVRYYFGRKEDLFCHLFESRQHLIAERMNAIVGVGGSPGPAKAEAIIRAWAEPVVYENRNGSKPSFSMLVARSVWEAGEENRNIVERFYDPLAHCFLNAMRKALPDADEVILIWTYEWSLGALLTFIANPRIERLSGGREKAADPARSEHLIRFIVSGFLAACKIGPPDTNQD